MKFESRKQPIARYRDFGRRQIVYLLYSLVLTFVSLLIGTLGYYFFTELDLIDGFYNASMILSGMGEVVHMQTTQSKIFSSIYAMYSSIAFAGIIAVAFAPLVHRFLHYLHIDEREKYQKK